MALNLQDFLETYGKQYPDDVVRVTRPIRTAYEITALGSKLEKQGRYPLMLCEQPLDDSGNAARMPVVTNLLSSRERCARILGSTFAEVSREYAKRVQTGIRPELVDHTAAPVQSVVLRGDEVDLTKFPVPTHHEWDPGPYITGGFFTCMEPNTGIDNTALQRGWVAGPREIRVFLAPNSHSAHNLRRYEAQGRDMPAAFWIGHHPAVVLGGAARKGYPNSHYETIGGLTGEALRVVPSVSLGEDFLVPADAEIVIEGYIRAGVRKPEGPFGEFTGYIGPQLANPVMEITAITHRKSPIWYDIQVGYAANRVIGGLALEAAVYETLRAKTPSVKAVYAPLSGLCRYNVYIQMDKPQPGEAREAILATLISHVSVKHAFVFDADVDIYDDREVLWAMATRTQWDRDFIAVPNLRGGVLDPSAPTPRTTAKGGFDCTIPPGAPYEVRNAVPQSVQERLKLEDYLTPERLAGLRRE